MQSLFQSILITNMNENFENIVTRVVQIAQKVAQMNKDSNFVESSQNCHEAYCRLRI